MPRSSVILDQVHRLLSDRLTEIDEERRRLERALAALDTKARRGPGRPRGRKTATRRASASPKSRRKSRGGGRSDQAVAVIEKSPGIGASDVAKRMKINPNYLYRVLGDLEKERRIRKDARLYFPVS